ncbi:MAG: hypothetical protein DRQ55_05895 [Planctomycetota bacterium]|nr:MAG: hypothetical protein DRQ55_05895 [Planctomycetota bacterium]
MIRCCLRAGTLLALLVLCPSITAQSDHATPLVDQLESELVAARTLAESLPVPDAKKLKLITKLIKQASKSTTTARADIGLLKRLASSIEKKLGDEIDLNIALELAVNSMRDSVLERIDEANAHVALAPPGKPSDKAQKRIDKAQAKLEKALSKNSLKAMAAALGGTLTAAEKAEAGANSATMTGPLIESGLSGYYTGSSSEGEWAAVYVAGDGALTIMAQGTALFGAMLNAKGKFTANVDGCTVKGKINSKGLFASAKCDGAVSYKLKRSNEQGPGALFAGIYEMESPSAQLETLITPEGKVFFNYADEADEDSGTGSINGDGAFSVSSDYGGTVTGNASPENGQLVGEYTLPKQPTKLFTLQLATGQAPSPLSISATQGSLVDRIEVLIEVPDLRSPHGYSEIRLHRSFTDQFADSSPVPQVIYSGGTNAYITTLGGVAASTYKRVLTKAQLFLISTQIKAPRFYFWATIITQDGEGPALGPVSGWASNRDTVPAIYLPHPEPDGATYRQQVKSGTPVGSGLLRARGNLPGVFSYVPPAGTVLPDGPDQDIEVSFTPAVMGYSPTTQTFQVTIGA